VVNFFGRQEEAMEVRPIKPSEVRAELKKTGIFPTEVIDAFNELIVKHFHKGYASFLQKEVVELIKEKMKAASPDVPFKEEEIFEKHWLDIEELFSTHGWEVRYDSPGYNETGESVFHFSEKK